MVQLAEAAPPLTLTATGKCWAGTPPMPCGAKRISPNCHSPACRPVLVAVIVSVTDEGRLTSTMPGVGAWSASRVNVLGDTARLKPGCATTLTLYVTGRSVVLVMVRVQVHVVAQLVFARLARLSVVGLP